ncbi:hypothetical protein SPONN_2691 [uncultured Candidatus Thioglobus sp.]|nr:hypothetical protein SPONN_2691 [uncultured Candidatus Thioglobus sp.]
MEKIALQENISFSSLVRHNIGGSEISSKAELKQISKLDDLGLDSRLIEMTDQESELMNLANKKLKEAISSTQKTTKYVAKALKEIELRHSA